jgi:hypothetical protein
MHSGTPSAKHPWADSDHVHQHIRSRCGYRVRVYACSGWVCGAESIPVDDSDAVWNLVEHDHTYRERKLPAPSWSHDHRERFRACDRHRDLRKLLRPLYGNTSNNVFGVKSTPDRVLLRVCGCNCNRRKSFPRFLYRSIGWSVNNYDPVRGLLEYGQPKHPICGNRRGSANRSSGINQWRHCHVYGIGWAAAG